MGFEVDTDALRGFQEFLEGYNGDAAAVNEYLYSDIPDMGVHEQGLMLFLTGVHQDIVDGMRARTDGMEDIAYESALAVGWAATFYDEMDREQAAKLDSTYDTVPKNEIDAPDGGSDKAGFEYDSKQHWLRHNKLKASDLERQASGIEEWFRWAADQISWTANLREFVTWVFGWDPVTWAVELFAGEWKSFAECALTWDACGSTTAGIAGNFDPALTKLGEVWQGNAADNAMRYFCELRNATSTEAEAFAALYQLYRLYVEFAREQQQLVNDQFNAVLDLVIDGILLVSGGGTALAIWDIIGMVSMALTALVDYGQLAETGIAALSLPAVPECALAKLPASGEPPSWKHPGVNG